MSDQNTVSKQQLYRAILCLKSMEDCERFFDDLCTIREITDMAQRLDAALLLDRNMSYQTIAQSVKISTATIGRVSKCLHYGAGGYRLVLDRLKEGERNDETNGCA